MSVKVSDTISHGAAKVFGKLSTTASRDPDMVHHSRTAFLLALEDKIENGTGLYEAMVELLESEEPNSGNREVLLNIWLNVTTENEEDPRTDFADEDSSSAPQKRARRHKPQHSYKNVSGAKTGATNRKESAS